MGDMAEYELESVRDMEYLRDEYVSGNMNIADAYEMGFVDSFGIEQEGMQDSWDRNGVPSLDYIDSQIDAQLALIESYQSEYNNEASLNAKAIENLYNEYPTCNICENIMKARNGKFGKFYFCNCEGQKSVSDEYWQTIKRTNI